MRRHSRGDCVPRAKNAVQNDHEEHPMFIDRARKVLFIHIPKTAGTAVTQTLVPQIAGDPQVKPPHLPIGEVHRRFLANEPWDEWTRFTVVRNPIEIIHSAYHFNRARGKEMKQNDRSTAFQRKAIASLSMTADRFAETFFIREPHTRLDQLNTDKRASRFTDVLRYEDLDSDFDRFIVSHGYDSVPLVRANVTEPKPPIAFSKTMMDKIAIRYKRIMDAYGYDVPHIE